MAPRYSRKYAFDKMIELEVPESVADFIEGRVPPSIGAKHYLALARQNSKCYPRYQAHIKKLRDQAQVSPFFFLSFYNRQVLYVEKLRLKPKRLPFFLLFFCDGRSFHKSLIQQWKA